MKNLHGLIIAVLVLGFLSCKQSDAQLAGQITEKASSAEANKAAQEAIGQNMNNLVMEADKAPDALKKDSTYHYAKMYEAMTTIQRKLDMSNDMYEQGIEQLKALAADYAAGKIKKEEAQQKYEELQSGLSKMSERIKSYEGNYNELSADFAKMMADFKAKGE